MGGELCECSNFSFLLKVRRDVWNNMIIQWIVIFHVSFVRFSGQFYYKIRFEVFVVGFNEDVDVKID